MAKAKTVSKEMYLREAGFDSLPPNWDVVQVEDLISDDRGISVGVMYPGKHDPDGIPLIKAGDLVGDTISPSPEFRVSPEKHEEYRRTEFQGGEILMTLVGKVGQCAVVPPEMKGWNAARAVAVIRLADADDAGFVRHCFLSRQLNHLMNAWANTTVQPTLNLKEIRKLPLPWPPKPERDAIASILGALDDKIELNRRMNATLESLARAIFKSWFVDFDPVKWKAEGGRQKAENVSYASSFTLPPSSLDLFPSTFQDSEFGPIPEDDPFDGPESPTVQELMDAKILDMGDGYRAKRVELADEGLPFVRAGNLHDGGFQFENVELLGYDSVEKAGEKKSEPFDVAFTSKGTVGRMTLVTPQTRDFVYSPQVCWWRVVDSNRLNPHVLYRWMKSDEFFRQVALVKGQTDMAEYVSLRDQRAMRVNLPAARFQNLIAPHLETIDATMASNRTETRHLAKLRDALLPQLLSGELPVPDALTATEEVLV